MSNERPCETYYECCCDVCLEEFGNCKYCEDFIAVPEDFLEKVLVYIKRADTIVRYPLDQAYLYSSSYKHRTDYNESFDELLSHPIMIDFKRRKKQKEYD